MKKILLSLGIIAVVAIVAINATGAFFSDSETSTGNTFTAGAIDLQIDSVSTYNGQSWATSTWALKDLVVGSDKFFNFDDIKPGDVGTTTVSIHVINNDAFVCAAVTNLQSDDNGLTEPEGDVDLTGGVGQGELDEEMLWTIWKDTNNNGVQDGGEAILASGNPTNGVMTLYDSATGPLVAPDTAYIGVSWTLPASSGNETQTDSLTGDISFYAVQSRNNGEFRCSDWTPSEPGGEQRVAVGAKLSAYVAPTACTTTVQPGSSIQSAIDAAVAGNTICVAPGVHTVDTYPLRVNKDNITLASTGGSSVTTLNGGVILDNDGTKLNGFTLGSSTLLGETFAVYINTGVDGAVVSYNDMNGPGTSSGRGVVTATGTVTTGLIANNDISNFLTGVFLNQSASMTVELNTLTGNSVGSANDNPTGNTIRKNHITGNSVEGVGVYLTGADTIMVNQNNIFGNGAAPGDELNSYAATAVNAEDNWWGDATPLDEIGGAGSAQVDSAPFEASALPLN